MRSLGVVLLVTLSSFPSTAAAQRVSAWSLRLRGVEPGAVAVDGVLGDWRGIPGTSLSSPSRVVSGADAWSGPDDASANVALIDDQENLVVGAHVRDERFVRTARYGNGEDQLVLTLAFPGSTATVEVHLLPGGPGIAAHVRRDGRDVAGATAVEMTNDHGWSAEFAIPWRALPEARAGRTGLRAALALVDCDDPQHPTAQTVLATAAVGRDAGTVPPLRIAAEEGVLDAFRRDRDLVGVTPSIERMADVAGDDALERVLVMELDLVAFGPGIRDGQSYVFRTLPVRRPSDVLGIEARDVTGDGKAEILVQWRETDADGERTLWGVFGVTRGEAPTIEPMLSIETGRRSGQRRIANDVRVLADGRIEQRPGAVTGFDEASWAAPPAMDGQTLLLPWEPILVRRFKWEGDQFVATTEERRAPSGRPRPQARPRDGAPTTPDEPPRAQAPTTDQLLDAFRAQVGLTGARTRFDASGDVGEDSRPERIAVIDRYLVIVGPGFADGTRWLFQELAVVSAADVLSLELVDVTGDGKKDLVVVTRQLGADVSREIESIQRFEGGRLVRVWSQEVARSGTAGQRVESVVRIVRHGNAPAELEVRAGRATGWTQDTWRFAPSAPPPEPLVLPWSTERRRTFRYVEGAFRPE